MVKQIIKEAMDKNPLGLKEAVESELQKRVGLALEAKMQKMKEEDEDESDDEDEDESDDEDEDESDDEDEDEDEDIKESFDLSEVRKNDWDYTDEQNELIKKAKEAGIKIHYEDKFVKGKKARGPRMPRKENVANLTRALANGEKKVTVWRN
jgi:hypothetical protein